MIDEMIKTIRGMSGEYSEYEILSDWIKAASLSIQNTCQVFHNDVWKDREQQYMDIVKKHGREKMLKMAELNEMLAATLEHEMKDALGEIYMKGSFGNKSTGQFFTPFHLSYLTAKLNRYEDGKICRMEEPSAGSGGMIIATARAMKEQGINYQRYLRVTARDIDWKGCYMSYLQLSILGIHAKVIQGDTLANERPEPYQILYTPKYMGVLL